MEKNHEQENNDIFSKIGSVFSAGLTALFALSPVFGEKGLIHVIPVPEGFQQIGPPLATAFSLFGIIAIVTIFHGRRKTASPWLAAIISFIIAVLSLAIYLSWIQGERIDTPLDSLWIISGSVLALFLFVIANAAFTCAFALVAIAFLHREMEPVDMATTYDELSSSEENTKTAESSNVEYSLDLLFALIFRAEWTRLSKFAEHGPKISYWKLYYYVSSLLNNRQKSERASSINSARFWLRLLSSINWLSPRFLNRNKPRRIILEDMAERIINTERDKKLLEDKRSESETLDANMFDLVLQGFRLILSYPTPYGYDQIYFDLKKSIREAVKLYGKLDSASRNLIHNTILGETIERMPSPFYPSNFSQDTDPMNKYDKFVFKTIQILAGLDLDNVLLFTGQLAHLRNVAIGFGKSMHDKHYHYPEGTKGKNIVAELAARAYCIAAAAAAVKAEDEWADIDRSSIGFRNNLRSDIRSKEFRLEAKKENIKDYVTSMDYLIDYTTKVFQELPAYRLASEYREITESTLKSDEENSSDMTESIEKI